MSGFKQVRVSTASGASVQYRPVVLSINLTPEQAALVTRATGQAATKLELTEIEIRAVQLAYKDGEDGVN
jgi:predicted DNA binding protein